MSRPPARAVGNDKCGYEKGQTKLVDRRPTPPLFFDHVSFPPLYKRPPIAAMNYPTRRLMVCLAFATALSSFAAEVQLAPLFNGRDLTHFKAANSAAFWRAENGVLIGENNAALSGNYLWTEKSYGDFVIEFEVRWIATTARACAHQSKRGPASK